MIQCALKHSAVFVMLFLESPKTSHALGLEAFVRHSWAIRWNRGCLSVCLGSPSFLVLIPGIGSDSEVKYGSARLADCRMLGVVGLERSKAKG